VRQTLGYFCYHGCMSTNTEHSSQKSFILFDLDNTLAESKMPLEAEMSRLFLLLLKQKQVGVISGCSFKQFKKQFLSCLSNDSKLLASLYILPTCGAAMYRYENDTWQNMYEETLTESDTQDIMDAFERAIDEAQFKKQKIYGDVFENRGTQITFSALGQEAPLAKKRLWDPDYQKRTLIKKSLDALLPEFEIRIGGTTSIDITRKGIDKGYGVRQINGYLNISPKDILFIGDALFEGGNDYPVKKAGVECIAVSGPKDTKRAIGSLL